MNRRTLFGAIAAAIGIGATEKSEAPVKRSKPWIDDDSMQVDELEEIEFVFYYNATGPKELRLGYVSKDGNARS